jgi:hypothetical protein
MGTHEKIGQPMIDKIGEYRKAVAAFLVPALLVLAASLIPDADGHVVVSASEWVAIAIAALGTSTVVGAVRNDPYTGGAK